MLAFLWNPSTKMIGLHCFFEIRLLSSFTSQDGNIPNLQDHEMLSHLPLFNVDKINIIHESSQNSSFLNLCLISICWNREWWIFSRFPHPFNRLPQIKLGASGDISDRQRVTSKWRRLRCLRNVPLSRRLNCWRFLLICWRSQKPERYEK